MTSPSHDKLVIFKSVEDVYKSVHSDAQVTKQVQRYSAIRDRFK